MSKWHDNRDSFDVRTDSRDGVDAVVDKLITGLSEAQVGDVNSYIVDIKCALIHKSYVSLGRPTYLVSADTATVAMSLEVNRADCENLFETLPYPTFVLAFERGVVVDGVEVESVQLANVSAFDSLGFGNSGMSVGEFDQRISRNRDCKFSNNAIVIRYGGRKFKIAYADDLIAAILGDPRNAAYLKINKMIISLMMLWRSRPHFVKPVTLPRSERYQFKGNRELLRQWVLPTELITRIKGSVVHGEGGNWAVRPHWRAGHFRHYRHERYARLEDGSVRVEFIEPCFVGDKEAKEVQAEATA